MKQSKNESAQVKGLDELGGLKEVQRAVDELAVVNKPNVELTDLLNKVGLLYKAEGAVLDKYMAKFTAWTNYLAYQMRIADIVRTVAVSQAEYFYSLAMAQGDTDLSAAMQKEQAKVDPMYQKARKISTAAETYYASLLTSFESCERGYALVSRIISRRSTEYNSKGT